MRITKKRVGMALFAVALVTVMLAPAVVSAFGMTWENYTPWKGGFAHWYVYCKARTYTDSTPDSIYACATLQELSGGEWVDCNYKEAYSEGHGVDDISAQTNGFRHGAGTFRNHSFHRAVSGSITLEADIYGSQITFSS